MRMFLIVVCVWLAFALAGFFMMGVFSLLGTELATQLFGGAGFFVSLVLGIWWIKRGMR